MVECEKAVEDFETTLKLEGKLGSSAYASQTVYLLLKLVWHGNWKTPQDLVKLLRSQGSRLASAQPAETSVGNMVRRVLKLVREEFASAYTKEFSGEVPSQDLEWPGDFQSHHSSFQEAVADVTQELKTELDLGTENMARQALEHIHSSEVILTAGRSRTVEAFLKKAAKSRKFQVIVAESAPDLQGQEQARRLAEAGVETTLITDSAVFAIMSRVNKVIIGTHTVLANGGLKALNGIHGIALAAKYHHVPLIVCTALLRLCPQFYTTSDQPGFNRLLSPEAVLSSGDSPLTAQAHLVNPALDYVPPELVQLFITNIGGIAPSYVYRQLQELYHPDDYQL